MENILKIEQSRTLIHIKNVNFHLKHFMTKTFTKQHET